MTDGSTNAKSADEFPIVGIGASAGGLEAFSSLLRRLPATTGMAYIFAQHLDPNHESLMPELLSRTTAMKVHEVQDGMKIVPDEVFLLPPNRNMQITDGHLKLTPRVAGAGRHMPIDNLLTSLAEIHGQRAIGVILSGNATDGTLGMKAIKAEGGLTFAQDPASAKFDGMPRSAIAGRCVDFVLPVERISEELARLGKHPYVAERPRGEKQGLPTASAPEPGAFAAGDSIHKDRVFALLRKASGVDFNLYKQTTIQRRIARRMVVHHAETLPAYVKLLEENPAELEALYHDILIKVTSFFRDPLMFEFLQSSVFPGMLKARKPTESLRIWIPGCATGEEVYSIAIALLETMGEMASNPQIQIFATDVSELALQTAREGKYLENISADVSPQRLRRFFVQIENGFQVAKSVRDLVIFARQNMTSDPPFSKLDLISCRNVLIYLDARLQKRVIPLFHYALRHNGFLVLGSSETIGTHGDMFTMLDKSLKVYAKKANSLRSVADFASSYTLDRSPSVMPGEIREPERDRSDRGQLDAQRDADRIILSRYKASGVLIDRNMDILQFRGDTSPYLEHRPGEPSLNILKMARDGLSIELRSMIHDARTRGATVAKETVLVAPGNDMRTIKIEVAPLRVQDNKEIYYLVLFDHVHQAPVEKPAPPEKSDVPADMLQRRLQQLTEELTISKQHLQSIIEEQEATNEELQSANEEVLSSNEELQSINEEMETAKEELQSTNEELTTVNEELQNRNLELRSLNNDLTNLLSSVSIPIIMLSSDVRIRRFTPLAEKLLSLIPTDVGRPLSDIKPRINVPDLAALVTEVIDTVTGKEIEVRDAEGHWYSMRIRPYKTRENKIEGAVIAFVDIDGMKRASVELRENRDLAEAIISTIHDSLIILDADCKVRKTNLPFLQQFALNPAEVEHRSLFELGNGEWNIPALRKMIDDIRSGPESVREAEITHTFPGVGAKRLSIIAKRLDYDTKTGPLLLVIHEKK